MLIDKFVRDTFIFIGKKAFFWLLIAFLSSLVLGVIELCIAFFIQLFLSSLGVLSLHAQFMGVQFPKLSAVSITLCLLGIGVIRFIAQMLSAQSASFILDYVNCKLRCLAIHDLLFKASQSPVGAAEINFKISELFPKSSSGIYNFVMFLTSTLQGVCIFLVMFLTAWKEACVGIIGILLIGFLVLSINRSVRKVAHAVPDEQFKLNFGIEKISKNLIFINIMRTQFKEEKQLVESAINYSSFSTRANFLNSAAASIAPFLGIMLIVTIIFFSLTFFKTSSLVMLSFLYLLIRFIQNLSQIITTFGVMNLYFPQIKQTFQYYNEYPSTERSLATQNAQALKFQGSKRRLTIPLSKSRSSSHYETFLNQEFIEKPPTILFENVSYRYLNTTQNIISNISFILNSGQQIGIIGPSGSGKTTLIMLLLGMFEPDEGEIKIDSESPGSFFKNPVYRVGYVGPIPFLVAGTIHENICYGIKRTVSESEIWDALKKASLKEFVALKSLDYYIAEDQSGLSAGQKQRLCLARAILNKPHLLVLDEATANLDDKTENEIAESIIKLKGFCTTIIVSHRPGILIGTDKLIELS